MALEERLSNMYAHPVTIISYAWHCSFRNSEVNNLPKDSSDSHQSMPGPSPRPSLSLLFLNLASISSTSRQEILRMINPK